MPTAKRMRRDRPGVPDCWICRHEEIVRDLDMDSRPVTRLAVGIDRTAMPHRASAHRSRPAPRRAASCPSSAATKPTPQASCSMRGVVGARSRATLAFQSRDEVHVRATPHQVSLPPRPCSRASLLHVVVHPCRRGIPPVADRPHHQARPAHDVACRKHPRQRRHRRPVIGLQRAPAAHLQPLLPPQRGQFGSGSNPNALITRSASTVGVRIRPSLPSDCRPDASGIPSRIRLHPHPAHHCLRPGTPPAHSSQTNSTPSSSRVLRFPHRARHVRLVPPIQAASRSQHPAAPRSARSP